MKPLFTGERWFKTAIGLVMLAVGCSASFTGSATADKTGTAHRVNCGGGLTCDEPYTCPPLAGGKCEAPSEVPERWMHIHHADAGTDASP